jgi:hypothetical protein
LQAEKDGERTRLGNTGLELRGTKDPNAMAALHEQAPQPDRDLGGTARLPGSDEEVHQPIER